MPGELLTAWTIRLALACYACHLAGSLLVFTAGSAQAAWNQPARWLWTSGCMLFVLHVACAFHFYHGWSHAAAFEKTASETEALLGVRFGEGIYFSYLFLALWVADVCAMWWFPRPPVAAQAGAMPRSGTLRAVLHAYLFFIALNGAIVFEAGPTRWAGIGVCLLLAGLALRAAYNVAGAECCIKCGRECQPHDGSAYPSSTIASDSLNPNSEANAPPA
jgi:hypothetical protein